MRKIFKIAICQTKVTENKRQNILEAYKQAKIAKLMNTDIIIFGEYFTNVVESKQFNGFAEDIATGIDCELSQNLKKMISEKEPLEMDSVLPKILESEIPAYLFLKSISYSMDLMVIGGSIVEAENDKLFNTCFIFDKGELLERHRKIHLFDVDVPGKITFKESETISPGSQPTIIKTRFGTFGIGICYDIRFASYAMMLRELGAEVLIYPSVFNQETGPRHFLLSGQARALDTQCFIILSSVAQYKDQPKFYQAFGHSAIIDCDGKIRQHLGRDEGILFGDIDLNFVDEIRTTIPYTSDFQMKKEIYQFANIAKYK